MTACQQSCLAHQLMDQLDRTLLVPSMCSIRPTLCIELLSRGQELEQLGLLKGGGDYVEKKTKQKTFPLTKVR